MTIGSRINELRTSAGIKQSTLGEAVGCSGQVISNIERGYSRPSSSLVDKCAAFFGVPADYILGRTASDYFASADRQIATVFSANINRRIAQLQMSLPDFICATELTEKSCEDILSGATLPSLDVAVKISCALDTTVDFLLGSSSFASAVASEDEEDLLLAFRKMSKREKRLFLGMMEQVKDK